MWAMLLDCADGEDSHSILGDRIPDLRPRELFVSKFGTHCLAGASDILYAVESFDDTSRQFATSKEIRSGQVIAEDRTNALFTRERVLTVVLAIATLIAIYICYL